MPTLSVCMIVKNEEELLPQCLESIQGIADEIIIVDTGSTDKTVEIAKMFKCKVFHRKWDDDFSAARNYSIEQATMDWIFIIDADECVDTPDVLTKSLKGNDGNAYVVDIINKYPGKEVVTHLPSLRVFKRDLELRYTNRVHNQLMVVPETDMVKIPLKILHYGYGLSAKKMAVKAKRTGKILKQVLKKNPYDATALFNLAQLMRVKDDKFNIKKIDEIIKLCERASHVSNPRRQKWWATYVHSVTLSGWAHLYKGNFSQALRLAMEAFRYKSNYLDAILLAGYAHMAMGEWKQGEHWFNTYIRIKDSYNYQDETDDIITSFFNQEADCYAAMGNCAANMGDNDKTINLYFAALKRDNKHKVAYNALKRINEAGKLQGAEWSKVEKMYGVKSNTKPKKKTRQRRRKKIGVRNG